MYMIHPVDQSRLPGSSDSLLEKLEQSGACWPCPSWAASEPTLLSKGCKRSVCSYVSSPPCHHPLPEILNITVILKGSSLKN